MANHKHSLSVPSTPANSRNHTTSSALISSVKSERCIVPPATPQRPPRMNQIDSNFTPPSSFSTPYTPISFRSVVSSNDSTLNTPGSAPRTKGLSFSASLEAGVRDKDKSLSDITRNWRSRANENGIKVSSTPDNPHYADDEASDHSPGFIITEEGLLPPPLLSTHRRARAQSHAVPPRTPVSPQVLRTPARQILAPLNTPPRKPSYAEQLKLKGSLTDPPNIRGRPSFGHATTQLSDIDENEYAPYLQSLCTPARPAVSSFSLNDPFHSPALSSIAESETQHFPLSNLQYQSHMQFHNIQPPAMPKLDTSSCSVCGRSSGALAILEPCGHPLCSACLTSALNIVGEKDMECAVCKIAVDNFHLRGSTIFSSHTTAEISGAGVVEYDSNTTGMSREYPGDLLVSPNPIRRRAAATEMTLLPSALDDAFITFSEGARDASTPVLGRQTSPKVTENVVLRVDNVPWDITPPGIIAWLKQPVIRVHVLLDRKGKTLSHAFVEVANEEVAKSALRDAQNSVLGKGKRARGVTVTRSGQEELMRALFPSWRGHFDGSRPSLAGLDNDHVISTLETGLISHEELTSLLHLIRSPDSHFLKMPSLPFHSLISILSKFPADIDSRVFWSGSLRDMLYDITFAAVQILMSHITANDGSGDLGLFSDLVGVGINCQAFTSQQTQNLCEVLNAVRSLTHPPLDTSSSPANLGVVECSDPRRGDNHVSPMSMQVADHNNMEPRDELQGPFGALAREFGVEAQLVEALAERLSAMH